MTARASFLLLMTCVAIARAQDAPAPQPGAAAGHLEAMRWVEREFLMPAAGAPRGLDVLLVEVERPGRHPLAILTHGTSTEPKERASVTPWMFLPQAIWFARRGYVVLVVVRRGYGRSSGESDMRNGGCQRGGGGSFAESGEESAEDLRSAAKYGSGLPEADGESIVSAGVSTGGFAQVALTAKPPSGLKAAISFAGGRGGDGKEHNCDVDGIVSAFKSFGKKSRVPMLWIYSENDHWFPPAMAQRFDAAFREGGGKARMVMVPPYREDGHRFYYNVEGWSPIVEPFLRELGMLPEGALLPEPPLPPTPPPAGLKEGGVAAFRNYLRMGPFKALATNGGAGWGMATGQIDQETADQKAVENCQKAVAGIERCTVVQRSK